MQILAFYSQSEGRNFFLSGIYEHRVAKDACGHPITFNRNRIEIEPVVAKLEQIQGLLPYHMTSLRVVILGVTKYGKFAL